MGNYRIPLKSQEINTIDISTMSFLRMFGKSKNTLGVARSLFFNTKNVADNRVWYDAGQIQNDFRSRQTMIMVHVWMVHRRLITEGNRGTTIQECMFDELWDDTCIRIRNAGINEMMVNKRLKDVQGYSFRSCMELDAAMTMPSEDEKLEEIAGTLWRSCWLRNNDIEPDHVIEMAQYVKDESDSIMNLSSEAVLEGRIEFGDTSLLWSNSNGAQKIMKGGKYVTEGSSDIAVEHEVIVDAQGGIWRTNLSSNGTIYYYNQETKETRWKKPMTVASQ
jgi:cytochrome b pre-mRNA-processing protein 3